MGNDSKDVKVGSLIGILAEPGEDWKSIQSSSDVKNNSSSGVKQQQIQEAVSNKEANSQVNAASAIGIRYYSRKWF